MTNDPGVQREPLVGGNLLNEQEHVQQAAQQYKHAEDEAVDTTLSGADRSDSRSAEDESDIPGGGAAIPHQAADSITEQQQTHGGGAVPPGSTSGGSVPPGSTSGGTVPPGSIAGGSADMDEAGGLGRQGAAEPSEDSD